MRGGPGRRKHLRTSVAAPGRVRTECLRKRWGSGGWPARYSACVPTTSGVGDGVEALN